MAHHWIEHNIIKTVDLNIPCETLGGVGNVFFEKLKTHGDKVAQVKYKNNNIFSVYK